MAGRSVKATASTASDGNNAQPVAVRLADAMRQRIAVGAWKPGKRIPPVSALAQEYGTSVFPVSQALQRLQREGLVTSRRGVATFVSPQLEDRRVVLHVMLWPWFPEAPLDRFRTVHPEYKVLRVPYVGPGPECDRLLGSVNAPDLVAIDSGTFNYIQPGKRLSTIGETEIEQERQDSLVSVERGFHHQGRQLGVPLAIMPFLWAARRSVFDGSREALPREDWTGDEMLDLLCRLTQDRDGDGVTDQFGYIVTPRWYTWHALFRALGGRMDSWDAIRAPASRRAAMRLWDAIFRHHISPPHLAGIHGRYGEVLTAAAETSRVATMLPDFAGLKNLCRRFGDDIVPLSSPRIAGGRRSSTMFCSGVGIHKHAVCREGALEMIRFLRSAEPQKEIWRKMNLLPVHLDLWGEVFPEDPNWRWLLLREIAGAIPTLYSNTPEETDAVLNLLEGLVRGRIVPAQFERALEERRVPAEWRPVARWKSDLFNSPQATIMGSAERVG